MAKTKDSNLVPFLLLGAAGIFLLGGSKPPAVPPVTASRPTRPPTRDFEVSRYNARLEHGGPTGPVPAPRATVLRQAADAALALTPVGIGRRVADVVSVNGLDPYDFDYNYEAGRFEPDPFDDDDTYLEAEDLSDFINSETAAYDDRINRVDPFQVPTAGPGFSVDSFMYGGS